MSSQRESLIVYHDEVPSLESTIRRINQSTHRQATTPTKVVAINGVMRSDLVKCLGCGVPTSHKSDKCIRCRKRKKVIGSEREPEEVFGMTAAPRLPSDWEVYGEKEGC